MGEVVEIASRRRPRKRLIGLTGRAGSGKDATAALLSMVGYTRAAFADQVRAEASDPAQVKAAIAHAPPAPGGGLAEAFGKVFGLRGPISIADDLRAITPAEVYAKPTSERARRVLQWWGTEYRRAQDEFYWARALIATLIPRRLYVISDVRFPNEATLIRQRGGAIWRIRRGGLAETGIPGHASESAVDDIESDLVIDNTGTMLDLAERVRAALGKADTEWDASA